jgi:hypothetical protein
MSGKADASIKSENRGDRVGNRVHNDVIIKWARSKEELRGKLYGRTEMGLGERKWDNGE